MPGTRFVRCKAKSFFALPSLPACAFSASANLYCYLIGASRHCFQAPLALCHNDQHHVLADPLLLALLLELGGCVMLEKIV